MRAAIVAMVLARSRVEDGLDLDWPASLAHPERRRAILALLGDCPPLPVVRGLIREAS